MTKKTGLKRLWEYWLEPKQIMVVEADNGRPAQNFHVRPVSLLMIPAISLILGAWLASHYFPVTEQAKNQSLLLQLQQKLTQARQKLATSAAENGLKQAQIHSLNDIIQQQQEQLAQLQQRIHVFNSILQARQGPRIQVVQAMVQRSTPHELRYHLTLVKGGNYPRRVHGSYHFTYRDQQGSEHILKFEQGKEQLPYHMETHTFLQGTVYAAGLSPIPAHTIVELVVYDERKREVARKKCTFEISL